MTDNFVGACVHSSFQLCRRSYLPLLSHSPCPWFLAQYMSLKDAVKSLIDGKIRHEYDRKKVTSVAP